MKGQRNKSEWKAHLTLVYSFIFSLFPISSSTPVQTVDTANGQIKYKKRREIHSYALKAVSSKGLSYEITLGSGEENELGNCKKKKKTVNNILCCFMKSEPHQNHSLRGQILLLKPIPKELVFNLLYSIALFKLVYLIKNHQIKTMSRTFILICINTKRRDTDF